MGRTMWSPCPVLSCFIKKKKKDFSKIGVALFVCRGCHLRNSGEGFLTLCWVILSEEG